VADVNQNINILIKQFGAEAVNKQIKGMIRPMDQLQQKLQDASQGKFVQATVDQTKAQKNLKKAFDQTAFATKRFRAEFLSILFLGMVIQRTFSRIAKSAIDSFTKIAEGSELANRTFGVLGASLTFLKFTIGEALARAILPMMPAIVAIIDAIAEWVTTNPKLTSSLIAIGFLLGTVLVTAGQLVLGLDGLSRIAGFMGVSSFPKFIKANRKLFIIIGLIVGAIALMNKALKETPGAADLMTEATKPMNDALSDLGKMMSGLNVEFDSYQVLAAFAIFLTSLLAGVFTDFLRTIEAMGNSIGFQIVLIQEWWAAIKGGVPDLERVNNAFVTWDKSAEKIGDGLANIITPGEALRRMAEAQEEAISSTSDETETYTGTLSGLNDELMNMTQPLIDDTTELENLDIEMVNAETLSTELAAATITMTDNFQSQIPVINDLAEAFRNLANARSGGSSGGGGGFDESHQNFQVGGYVPKTGMALVHAGEFVVPREKVSSFTANPNINVRTGPISNQVDVAAFAKKISSVIMGDIRRHTSSMSRYG